MTRLSILARAVSALALVVGLLSCELPTPQESEDNSQDEGQSEAATFEIEGELKINYVYAPSGEQLGQVRDDGSTFAGYSWCLVQKINGSWQTHECAVTNVPSLVMAIDCDKAYYTDVCDNGASSALTVSYDDRVASESSSLLREDFDWGGWTGFFEVRRNDGIHVSIEVNPCGDIEWRSADYDNDGEIDEWGWSVSDEVPGRCRPTSDQG